MSEDAIGLGQFKRKLTRHVNAKEHNMSQRTVLGHLLHVPVIYRKIYKKTRSVYSGAVVYSEEFGLALARRNPDAEQETRYSRPKEY